MLQKLSICMHTLEHDVKAPKTVEQRELYRWVPPETSTLPLITTKCEKYVVTNFLQLILKRFLRGLSAWTWWDTQRRTPHAQVGWYANAVLHSTCGRSKQVQWPHGACFDMLNVLFDDICWRTCFDTFLPKHRVNQTMGSGVNSLISFSRLISRNSLFKNGKRPLDARRIFTTTFHDQLYMDFVFLVMPCTGHFFVNQIQHLVRCYYLTMNNDDSKRVRELTYQTDHAGPIWCSVCLLKRELIHGKLTEAATVCIASATKATF